ncbi:MAG: hypothetical protein GX135_07610 [Candidatus Cloacimonetes bacterium]|nr:hypothetical protein [Candidatus Cloacimonadota bacterium]
MLLDKELIVITDIGSTTTKALLLENGHSVPELIALANAPTSVEAPQNDVRHGIVTAARELENLSGKTLLLSSEGQELNWAENVAFFSTSSAGGGLQILVIGLTLYDSASSAKRGAYGAGGVILDTFAIDDKRQAMEQMLAMRNLHPDMILLCGGTDGGAISGVLRMAEIVRIANPSPKFDLHGKIPAIYAGNKNAAPIIQKLISKEFDLHILPNLRPSPERENLRPTQETIQKLFMENVMEHAPGYANVKPRVSAPIIPTPMGVQNALALLAQNEKRNIFAFDIGGATTDVFSIIDGHFQRTVSANMGMSYSAWNILKECGAESLLRWLPPEIDEKTLRNYVANKCLHPTSTPKREAEYRIEHALAREALSVAIRQHREMHYNTAKIGYLDILKQGEIEKFQMQFEFQREDKKHRFAESEIDVIIGAGGVFTSAQNRTQSLMMLIDAIRPKGVTEIWTDRNFISPHLGIFGKSAPEKAHSLLESNCFEKIGLHIAPVFSPRQKKNLFSLTVETASNNDTYQLKAGQFILLPEGEKTLSFKLSSRCSIPTKLDLNELKTTLPVVIDLRTEPLSHQPEIEKTIGLYPGVDKTGAQPDDQKLLPALVLGSWTKKIELSYLGDTNPKVGDEVAPDDIVAVNRFNPPRLYIIDGFSRVADITPAQIQESLQIGVGDSLESDQVYAVLPAEVKLPRYGSNSLRSPVRGKIEFIDPDVGIMVASEIQDYSSKPVKIDYAQGLGIPPKIAKRYLSKRLGDFVYRDDVLAKRVERGAQGEPPVFIKSPSTGTVTEIDTEKGIMTVAYIHSPLLFHAHVHGTVTEVNPGRSVEIQYQSLRLEGRIAFGKECHGSLVLLENEAAIGNSDIQGKIVALTFPPTGKTLELLAKERVVGMACFEMDASELTTWLEFEPGVINTGNEALPFGILVLNGFGQRAMPPELASTLKQHNFCYLNPHTRIRAGVVRPFLSFPPQPGS